MDKNPENVVVVDDDTNNAGIPDAPPEAPKSGKTKGRGSTAASDERNAMMQLRNQRKVRIVIASGSNPEEQYPVPVACNGYEYLIKRDEEVEVPIGILNVLKLAQIKVPTFDSQGRVSGWKSTMRHNVSVVDKA